MFKRKPRSYHRIAGEMIYPRGGWLRAGRYVWYRLRRLPDQPQRIGRGVAAGVFICFTPLFGFHFLGAAALAWIIGGNILAALLATFIGNPVTFPLIAMVCLGIGRKIMGIGGRLGPQEIFAEFSAASSELWQNILAVFSPGRAHWEHLAAFFDRIYLPYMVGGIVPGLIAAVISYYLTLPVVRAYHARRKRKDPDAAP